MKKKLLFSIFVIAIILVFGIVFHSCRGEMPFKGLKDEEVERISLFVIPPETTIEIEDKEQIKEIVEILNTVVTYQEDDSGREHAGQLVRYTLKLIDGSILEIGAYNPFIYINGICYKTKYEPCAKLNAFGNMFANHN